jgi:hypothetical protein
LPHIRVLPIPRAPLALCLAVSLAACGANHSIDVTRRTTLSPAVKGAPFLVLLSEDEGNDPSYHAYATELAGQLQARGLAGVNDPKKAHYAVMLERDWPQRHHASDDDSTRSDTSGRGGHGGGGGFGGGGGHHHGGGGLNTSDRETNDATLRIAIFDLTKPKSPDERVFFASAHAPSGHEDEDSAINAMIEAALRDFPGKPHEAFSVPLPK